MVTELIHLRLDTREKENLQRVAQQLGITMNALIRRTSFIFSRLDGVFWDSLRYLSERSALTDDKILEIVVLTFMAKVIARSSLGQDQEELDELKTCYYVTSTAKGDKHSIDLLVEKFKRELAETERKTETK